MKFFLAAGTRCASLLLLFSSLSQINASAVEPDWVFSVQLSATVQDSPPQIALAWEADDFGAASYTVFRKSKTATAWGNPIASLDGSATGYTDTSVSVGQTYEYQVVKVGSLGYTAYGYIYSGINAALTEGRGTLVLLVATESTASLGTELARLKSDLIGDGWQVIRHDVSTNDTPAHVRSLVVHDYNADPANVKAVFLFGHIPILQSGSINYDGHGARPMPADPYYGDMDGNWSSSPSFIPSDVELMVGRVDMADLPGAGAATPWPNETELLRNYLNKDHKWRFKQMTAPRRALIADRFGTFNGETRASSGYRNLEPLVGPGNTSLADVSDGAAPSQRWISLLSSGSYLWTYGNGGGQDTSISELGLHGQYDDVWSTDLYAQDPKTVFFLLEGSHFGNWDHTDNIMRSVLAMPTMGLEVCCIAGHPQWYIHHFGLGEPLGYSVRLTMNNGTLYKDSSNEFNRVVYIALMGDPALRMEPIAPASNLRAGASGSVVSLNWATSSDGVVGYHVYRAATTDGPFVRLTDSLVSGSSFQDPSAPAGANTYMVRAVALQTNPSGSYYDPSQGVFVSLTVDPTSTNTTPIETGNYAGLFYESDQVRQTSAGYFSVSIKSKGVYNGYLQMGNSRLAFKGTLADGGSATNEISRPHSTPLSLNFQVGSDSDSGEIVGQVTDGTWTANLSAELTDFNSKTDVSPQAGNYTLQFPGVDGQAQLPAGNGYATAKVTSAGKVSMAGMLADGTAVSESSSVTKNGLWPLYISLYGGKGSLLGWFTFAQSGEDDVNGSVNWIKPATPKARAYPDGFTVQTVAGGSIYLAPSGGNSVLALSDAQVTFSGGGLAADFANSITISANHVSNQSSNRLSLTFAKGTGRFSGSVRDPSSNKSLPFSGVVLQKRNSGSGFLLYSNQSSRVTIAP